MLNENILDIDFKNLIVKFPYNIDKVLFYLYHPFSGKIIEQFLKKIDILSNNEIYIIYVNGEYEEVYKKFGYELIYRNIEETKRGLVIY